jgi:hypothetical protein
VHAALVQDERLSSLIRGNAQGLRELDLPPKAANREVFGVILGPAGCDHPVLQVVRSRSMMIVACLEAAS